MVLGQNGQAKMVLDQKIIRPKDYKAKMALAQYGIRPKWYQAKRLLGQNGIWPKMVFKKFIDQVPSNLTPDANCL